MNRKKIFFQKSLRGQVSLELTITLILLLALLFFVWDMAMISYNWVGLQFATNEGARVGAQMATFDSDAVETATEEAAKKLGVSDAHVDATLSAGVVTLRASKTVSFTPLTKGVFQLSGLGSGFTVYSISERTQEPGNV